MNNLDKQYTDLLQSKLDKIKYLEEKLEERLIKEEKKINPKLDLKIGDWIHNEYSGETDKVRDINRSRNSLTFYFGDKNAVLLFFENKMGTNVVRYATIDEILNKLEDEQSR
jgi:hypothetical protein